MKTIGFIKNIVMNIKNTFGMLFKYEIMIKLLISAVMLPLISYFINKMLDLSGYEVVTNNSLLSFGLSLEGFITILILAILSGFLILFEIGGVVLVSHTGKLKSEELNLGTVFFNTLKKAPKIAGFGGLLLVIYIMIIAPFIGFTTTTTLIQNLNFPPFVLDFIGESPLYLSLYVLLFAMGLVLTVRWMFVFHYIMIENQSCFQALRSSGRLVRKYFKSMILKVLIVELIMVILSSVFVFGWSSFINFIYSYVDVTDVLSRSIVVFFSFIQSLGMLIGTMFIVPVNMYVLTELFYEYNYIKRGFEVPDCKLSKVNFGMDIFNYVFSKKTLLLSVSLLAFVISSLLWSFVIMEDIDMPIKTEITAHRGSSAFAPENTISSIQKAIEQGCDFVEIDVQETKDGKIVVIHDSYLQRLTGVPRNVWEVTYDEMMTYEVGSWFSEEFRGEKIPTLDEVIKHSKGKIKINIELKPHGYDVALEKSVAKIINDNDFKKECVVTSLNYDSLIKMLEEDQTIPTGYIMFAFVGDYIDMDIDVYSVEESKVTKELVDEIHKRNKKIHVWTVNDEEAMIKQIELGVDNIITDDPLLLKKVIADIKNKPFDENLFELLY